MVGQMAVIKSVFNYYIRIKPVLNVCIYIIMCV